MGIITGLLLIAAAVAVTVLNGKLDFNNSKLAKTLQKLGLSPVSVIAFIGIFLIPVVSPSEYFLRVFVTALIRGTLAMGFDLSAGFIGVANWGYAALMGLGGYTSALLLKFLGVTPWIGMIIGALFATLVGLGIGLITLRMSGIFAALLAWFVGLILRDIVTGLPDLTRGAKGLNVKALYKTPWATPYFYTIGILCLIIFIALRLMTRSNLGMAFRALGQDMQAAQTTGVSPMKYRLINFCTSCFIAGLVGGFYAHYIGILAPNTMSTKNTIEILVLCYVGGRGSIWGPLLASFVLTPIFESMSSLVELKYIIYGVVLILVMIFMPQGFSGVLGGLEAKIKAGKGGSKEEVSAT